MHDHLQVFTAIGLGLGLAVATVQGAVAQQNSVTAIDVALEPAATMIQHARDANARLLKDFPEGFPHVTIGVGTEEYLNKMLAEPFASFSFSAAGASVYQLGSFGTARKELRALSMTP